MIFLLINESFTYPNNNNVIISFVWEIRFWSSYLPTFWLDVIKYPVFFLTASLTNGKSMNFVLIELLQLWICLSYIENWFCLSEVTEFFKFCLCSFDKNNIPSWHSLATQQLCLIGIGKCWLEWIINRCHQC